MTLTIDQHQGKKYLRKIYPARGGDPVEVDVYAVLEAFDVTCPAVAHCLKKLLAPGQRGKGSVLDDLIGAEAGLSRAIEMEKIRVKRQEEADPNRFATGVKKCNTDPSPMTRPTIRLEDLPRECTDPKEYE